MFYATAKYKDEQASEDNQFGGEVWVNDLWRFDTKKERDEFVSERSYSSKITRRNAEKEYPEQFAYWKNQK